MKTQSLLLVVAATLINLSTLAQNQQKVDSLMLALKKCKIDTTKVLLFYQLGNEWEDRENVKAEKYFNDALTLSKKINFKNGLHYAYNGLGKVYISKGLFKQAIGYMEEGLKVCIDMKDDIGMAAAYDNIGIAHVYLGNYDTAIAFRKKAIDIYQTRNDSSKIAGGYQWIGICQKANGNYSLALDNFLKALRIYEVLKEDENVVFATLNCANVYKHQKNYAKALEWFFNGLAALKKNGSQRVIATVHYDIGNVYDDQKKHKEALENHLIALKIRKEINDLEGLANSYNAIAGEYDAMNKFEEAEKYYIFSLKIAKDNGYKATEVDILINLGKLFVRRNKLKESISYYLQGLSVAKSIGQKESISACYADLSFVYEKLDEGKNALKYFKLHKEMDDSLKNETMSKNILELQTAYDTEKKDKTIAELNVKNLEEQQAKQQREYWFLLSVATTIIILLIFYFFWKRNKERFEKQAAEAKQEALKAQINQERFERQLVETKQEALNAQMSDHFIGNTMDSINNFIEANEKEKASEYLLRFHRLIREVLENSFKKLVSLQDDLKVLDGYLQLEKLRFAENAFTYSVEIDKGIDPSSTQIPPMVLQILAENSIKHGLKKEHGGHILLSVKKQENTIQCIVEDNGIGRAASKELKSSNESNVKTSLGTGLAETLIKLFSGIAGETSFKFVDLFDDKHNATGTRVEFTIPFVSTN